MNRRGFLWDLARLWRETPYLVARARALAFQQLLQEWRVLKVKEDEKRRGLEEDASSTASPIHEAPPLSLPAFLWACLRFRVVAALLGIAVAVCLVLIQLGFRDALFASVVRFYSHLKCDIVVISPQYQYLLSAKTVSKRRLYEALGVAGVESVNQLDLAAVPGRTRRPARRGSSFWRASSPRPGSSTCPR